MIMYLYIVSMWRGDIRAKNLLIIKLSVPQLRACRFLCEIINLTYLLKCVYDDDSLNLANL